MSATVARASSVLMLAHSSSRASVRVERALGGQPAARAAAAMLTQQRRAPSAFGPPPGLHGVRCAASRASVARWQPHRGLGVLRTAASAAPPGSISALTQMSPEQQARFASEAPPPPERTPAEADAMRFELDETVAGWANYAPRFRKLAAGDGPPPHERSDPMAVAREVLGSGAVKDGRSAAFWAYHSARLGFFIVQAAAGLLAHEASERMRGVAAGSDASILGRVTRNASTELVTRVAEAVGMWYQDLRNIEAGHYKLPWDMVTLNNRQYNPLFALRNTVNFMQESAATLERRVRGTGDPIWLQGPAVYPQYYAGGFHYQSDGWLSARSADIYEHSTETLFFGRQDAMQRLSLVPIARHVDAAAAGDAASLRLLEVGAGTGRFHTFIKDNWPEMPSVVSDLSPFYLSKARENIEHWRRTAMRGRNLGGGPDGANVEYMQCAAEALPSPNASFDIVVCVYVFHELPEPVRRAAVAEFFRVLRPGGIVVFNDSVQLGDRPEWDATIGNFGVFNEPYYRNYVTCDLGAMFEDAGFMAATKSVGSASKCLTFAKPAGRSGEAVHVGGVEGRATAA